jgi:hypothetical protein
MHGYCGRRSKLEQAIPTEFRPLVTVFVRRYSSNFLWCSNKLEVNMAEHERYTMHCRGSISALLQPTGEILID